MNRLYNLLLILIFLTACSADAITTPTPSINLPTATSTSEIPILPTPLPESVSPVLFSEVLAGVTGNNNYEFIELYNRSSEIVDLLGWALWYRLPTSQEDVFVYRWSTSALIPPHGHYLLGRLGQELGLPVDAHFDLALNTAGGGLQLRKMDGTVIDALGWGSPQAGFYEGDPAPVLQNGLSLERLPGGSEGNALDLDNNLTNFQLANTPNPQNSGSPLTPFLNEFIELSLNAPDTAEPGTKYAYTVSVTNHCGVEVKNVQVMIPIHPNLVSVQLPNNTEREESILTWHLDSLGEDETQQIQIPVEVPWTYFTAQVSGYYALAEGCPLPSFGAPIATQIEGGVIPIGTARTLLGADLTIEGIATAYTGAYYAGTGNVKFYLEDDTGAIQVQVFEGEGCVGIGIGTHVSVRGNVNTYRGSTQIVPIVVPDDVITLEKPSGNPPKPTLASIESAENDLEVLPGKLVQVQGIVTRLEEFSYSYEMDLTDSADPTQMLTLYIDKQTNIQVEQIEIGDQYIAIGILDIRDTRHLLYPRIQEDLQQIYPPAPRLEVNAPALVECGQPITYTLTAINHTSNPLTNVLIQAELPIGTSLMNASQSSTLTVNTLSWLLPELAPNGGSQSVEFSVTAQDTNQARVNLSLSSLTATEWQEPVIVSNINTFTRGQVPIWAIQDNGFRSPYVLTTLTTQGVVTGQFPDLGGFFLQEIQSDENPLTSPGLFIFSTDTNLAVQTGDMIQVTGKVREISGQTALQITGQEDIELLAQGNSLPLAIEIDPPTTLNEALVYYEALEGAFVQVSGPALAVSPITKYGETVLVLPKHGVNRLYQGEDNGIAIMIDDGSSVTHADSSTLPYTITTGDTVSQVIGPLAYTYNHYKIKPTQIPRIERTGLYPATLLPAVEKELSLMTWNVENLFDSQDPNPTDPPKPLPSVYRRHLEKVANTIIAAGAPTIVALQEVENLGVLEDLVTHDLLKPYHYDPVLIEGFDSRGIDVGYLVRGDQASILDIQQRDAPAGLFSRPPLLLKLEVEIDGEIVDIYLLNNHFVSMSGGVEATEPQRTAQADWNLQLVKEIQASEPDALVAVMGDLNSFFESQPIQILRDGGMVHVLDLLPPELRYTYIFEGESQVLDHILITESFLNLLNRVEILHVNADFPLPNVDDTSPWHKSDHDPVVATFTIK